jgi:hypothetical protein
MPRQNKTLTSQISQVVEEVMGEFQVQLTERLTAFMKESVSSFYGLDTGDSLIEKHVASLIDEAKQNGRKKAVRRRSRTKQVRTRKKAPAKTVRAARSLLKAAKQSKVKPVITNGSNNGYSALKTKVMAQT